MSLSCRRLAPRPARGFGWHASQPVPGVPRDSHGKIKRDPKARADLPSNMQWQTNEAARAKDKVE